MTDPFDSLHGGLVTHKMGNIIQNDGNRGATYSLNYLLTYSMEQRPYSEANRFSVKKFPHFTKPESSLPHSEVPGHLSLT